MTPRGGMLASKLVLIFVGAYIGAVALFFGGGLAIVGLSRAGLIKSSMPFDLWIIVSMTAGAVIGGSLGYLVFRKSRLSDPDYYKPF